MNEDEKLELEFLRHFYSEAGEAFGPADDDIYRSIAKSFTDETGKELPKGYGRDDE